MDLSMSTTRASSPAIQIDPKDAEKYGLREVEILASTNEKCLDRFPDPCWALKKTISTVRNFEFEQLYSSKLQEPILATVKQATSAWKQIHVVRLGFQLEEKDPLVTLIIINNSSLSRRSAQALATKIHAIITSQWSGESIRVDICQIREPRVEYVEFCSPDSGSDVLDHNPDTYLDDHPRPGASVGPEAAPNCAGTLSGYIIHDRKVFALTNAHVVNGKTCILGSKDAYFYKPGQRKYNVMSPAVKDHDATRWFLPPGNDYSIKVKHQMDNYNTRLGYVYATSNLYQTKKPFCLDWALIACSSEFSKNPNKHRYQTTLGLASPAKRKMITEHGHDWFENAKTYFNNGPTFKPIRRTVPQTDETFLKPPGRSTGWREASCNGIQSIINQDTGNEYKEYAFITHPGTDVVSTFGDSGTIIMDKDFHPTTMIWGGKSNVTPDITFATPLHEIFADIELNLGWEKDSIDFAWVA